MSTKVANTTTAASSDAIQPRRRIAPNYLLIWVDASIEPSNKDCQNILAQLRSVVNDVHIFTEQDECINFLTEVDDSKAFLIVAGTIGQEMVPLIHDIPQLDAIYVFCNNKSQHEHWAKEWVKVKGVQTEITPICTSLERIVRQCNQDAIAVSFVAASEGASNQKLDRLEPSFMYTQIFKEILLGMKYDQQSVKNFVTYCRNGDYGSPSNITRFDNEYEAKLAIWWYTFPSFIYSMLNYALRMLEAGTIIEMGFFIYDLHRQIEELHQKQANTYRGKSFTVYRGQGLSTADFEKLRKTKGGLMSFNNFLSTSKDREVSLGFAEGALTKTDTIGILFDMFIDPSVSSKPFASIEEFSYYTIEEEILFSMHTVFRVGEIIKIDNNNPLYQVELKLTADDDEELRTLTKRIREEAENETGWQRLGKLLLKISQFDKAEELYKILLEQTSNEGEKAHYYNQLGYVKEHQGDYENAIWYFEKAFEIEKQTSPNHPNLATSYSNIGQMYNNIGEYAKALSFYEKALEIEKNTPPNHPNLATSYNNIGLVYDNIGEYSKALSFYEKALEIRQKILPTNHPDLATSYNNIAAVYYNIGEYSKVLSFYEKALEIDQKTLPPSHPSLATYFLQQYRFGVLQHGRVLEITFVLRKST